MNLSNVTSDILTLLKALRGQFPECCLPVHILNSFHLKQVHAKLIINHTGMDHSHQEVDVILLLQSMAERAQKTERKI